MNKNTKKILILVPALTARGGINNYYHVLRNHFDSKYDYFLRGARTWPVRKGTLYEFMRAFKDLLDFIEIILRKNVDLVQTNTSLGLNSFVRDGFFLFFSRIQKLRTIAFIHGWNFDKFEKHQTLYIALFKLFFSKADLIIVLNNRVKNILISCKVNPVIIKETTLFDKRLTIGVNSDLISEKFDSLLKSRKINFLYLSRVEKAKGIFDLIEAVKKIKEKSLGNNNEFSLTVCGDGFELNNLSNIIKNYKLTEIIKVKGFVEGIEKINAFKQSHVFIFPSHTEGMPVAVLEAMGFGLPVVTTPVGGIVDFFKNPENGYLIDIKSPEDIANKLMSCIINKERLKRIAINNYEFANQNFRSDVVADRIKIIHRNIIENKK